MSYLIQSMGNMSCAFYGNLRYPWENLIILWEIIKTFINQWESMSLLHPHRHVVTSKRAPKSQVDPVEAYQGIGCKPIWSVGTLPWVPTLALTGSWLCTCYEKLRPSCIGCWSVVEWAAKAKQRLESYFWFNKSSIWKVDISLCQLLGQAALSSAQRNLKNEYPENLSTGLAADVLIPTCRDSPKKPEDLALRQLLHGLLL